MNPTIPWRTFSIFISSTFADMQAERDYLKNIFFPRFEEELQKRRMLADIRVCVMCNLLNFHAIKTFPTFTIK